LIYHITSEERWLKALDRGYYEHESLKNEGFIHCSFLEQIPRTLTKHFPQESQVYVLHIVEKRVRDILRKEANPESGEIFPHLYGKMDITAIEDVSIWEKDENGAWRKS
jgi:uncharacterized protein (DUF952 family)